jgi:hypothetical protein
VRRTFLQTFTILLIGSVTLFALATSANAGIYNTAETDEIRLNATFKNLETLTGFWFTLKDLQAIVAPRQDFEMSLDSEKRFREPPIRKRYVLMEALAGK